MKVECACIPCIMKQAYNTAVRATKDTEKIRHILDLTADYVKTIKFNTTPADASNFAYRITREVTGNCDPYKEEKKKFNDICLSMANDLKNRIINTQDPIRAAVKVAILGNLIDLGIGLKFDLNKDLERVFKEKFAVDDYNNFKEQLDSGKKHILYLGDNAGEIVFDRLLVEQLKKDHNVTFVVKKGPVINDATVEDAEYTGMKNLVPIIDTGSDGIGIQWSTISEEFLENYNKADIIISKGQGNFETMSDKKREIYFLLRAKCDCVARKLGVSFGDIVFKKGPVI